MDLPSLKDDAKTLEFLRAPNIQRAASSFEGWHELLRIHRLLFCILSAKTEGLKE